MQRILSKILANRFVPFIDKLVDSSQSGFIPNRNIIENFLYAQQVIHFAEKQKLQLGVLKADLHKAFDTLNWSFIDKVLTAVGAPSAWTSWISGCILRGTSQVLVNGTAGRRLHLKRGVRQGDPISPYLFILAFDFLSRWLKSLTRTGALILPFTDMQPALFYADDSLIFFRPCREQVRFIQMILLAFQHISGLALNRTKFDLLVTASDEEFIVSLATTMGCRASSFPITYLGLPLSPKKLLKRDYMPLINRISRKLSSWSASLLSPAGRLVLLNACLSSMPLYFMSAFQLPKWVIKDLDKIRMRFFWHGPPGQSNRLILVSWDTICLPKRQGRLGVLNLPLMNRSLLAKWLWTWTTSKDKCWSQLASTLQGHETTLAPAFSPLYSAFREVLPLFCTASHTTPKDGSSVLFWHHNWGHGILQFRFSDLYSFAIDCKITLAQFLEKWRRDEQLFQATFHSSFSVSRQWDSLLQFLSNLRLQPLGMKDVFHWKLTDGGYFSVSSFYKMQIAYPKVNSVLAPIWKLNIPPRMRIFIWQAGHNKIATLDNLKKRGWQLPNFCHMCCSAEESIQHLFNECNFFQSLLVLLKAQSTSLSSLFFTNSLGYILDTRQEKSIREVLAILCFIV